MKSEICTENNIEKQINNFCNKLSEFKDCNHTRGLKHYYECKDKNSKQQKIDYEIREIKSYYRRKQ